MLLDRIRRRIALTGPITVADYMAAALGDPEWGYYMTRDPLGATGDFTTAPEISQVFGEVIGAWILDQWHGQGRPADAVLAELGPGRGTLMADALRGRRQGGWPPAPQMVETSPVLRASQAQALKPYDPAWHDSIASLPDGPLFCIANEFFDALPIRQFVRRQGGFREIRIGAGEAGLIRIESPVEPALVPAHRHAPGEGDIVERCAPGEGIVHALAARIAERGGALLIIDYGYGVPDAGDSLQALAGHRPVDPLADPGNADITAHVDFTALGLAAREAGAAVFGPVGQGPFLAALGAGHRFAALAEANPAGAEALQLAWQRLTMPEAMGTLFKVLAILPPAAPKPPGFP